MSYIVSRTSSPLGVIRAAMSHRVSPGDQRTIVVGADVPRSWVATEPAPQDDPGDQRRGQRDQEDDEPAASGEPHLAARHRAGGTSGAHGADRSVEAADGRNGDGAHRDLLGKWRPPWPPVGSCVDPMSTGDHRQSRRRPLDQTFDRTCVRR